MTKTKLLRLERFVVYLDIVLMALLAISIFGAVTPYWTKGTEVYFGVIAGYLFLAIGLLSAAAITLNVIRASELDKEGYIKRLLRLGLSLYGLGTVVVAVCSFIEDGRLSFLYYTLVGICMMGYIYAGILTLLTFKQLADQFEKSLTQEKDS